MRKRSGLNKAIANTSPQEAANNLEARGLNLERYRSETRAHARAKAAGFASALEPLAMLEVAVALLEDENADPEVAGIVANVMAKVASEHQVDLNRHLALSK